MSNPVHLPRTAGFRVIVAGALALASTMASAAEKLFLTGAEVADRNSYVFLGAILPIGGSTLGNGWVQRYWADHIRYEYDSGNRTIKARAYGLEAALGYQKSSGDGWAAAYAGARYLDTSLSPDDPDSEARGEHLRAKLQLEGEKATSPAWRLGGIVSYTFGADSYWVRVRAMHGPARRAFGPEFIFHGDPDYSAQQVGLAYAGFEPVKDMVLGVKAGMRFSEGDRSPYLGLELVYPFY
jgi:Cellulose biosynthesis protein BcsS